MFKALSYLNRETIKFFNDRVFSEFKTIVEDNLEEKKDILIIAHGGTNRIILGNLFKLSFSDSQRIIKQSNGCINEITFGKYFNKYNIENLNVTSHLIDR